LTMFGNYWYIFLTLPSEQRPQNFNWLNFFFKWSVNITHHF
jgi:hypothetical protein